ncbi:MAG: hypothetical protein BWZ02_00054 [Lentisphaerae bacterium ADurb.BinA184]|nr:MAG: hypothetical protein BWZ02_00054 [Lentisphaerae bacterium ADurb.BinA184]
MMMQGIGLPGKGEGQTLRDSLWLAQGGTEEAGDGTGLTTRDGPRRRMPP